MLFNDAFSFYSRKLEPPGVVIREIFLSSLACVVSKAGNENIYSDRRSISEN